MTIITLDIGSPKGHASFQPAFPRQRKAINRSTQFCLLRDQFNFKNDFESANFIQLATIASGALAGNFLKAHCSATGILSENEERSYHDTDICKTITQLSVRAVINFETIAATAT